MKQLSKREIDVMELILEGLRNPDIADKLGLSRKTVENHVRSILRKTETKNRLEAAMFFYKRMSEPLWTLSEVVNRNA